MLLQRAEWDQTLPLLIAFGVPIGAAILAIVVRHGNWRHEDGWIFGAASAAVLAPILALTISFIRVLGFRYVIVVVLLSAAITFLAIGATSQWKGAGGLGVILFAAITVWSGSLAFIGDLGVKDAHLASVLVKRKSMPLAVQGFFLGRTAKSVYIANSKPCSGDGCRRVLSIGDADVGCLVFGPDNQIPKPPEKPPATTTPPSSGELVRSPAPQRAPTPLPTPTPSPTPTPDIRDISDFTATEGEPDPCAPKPAPTATRTASAMGNVPASVPALTQSVTVNVSGDPATSRLVLRSAVLFQYGDDQPTRAGEAQIKTAAQALRAARSRRVIVAGHADSRGTPAENVDLSWRRAVNVRKLLKRALGRSAERMEIRAHGESAPLGCEVRRNGTDNWIARAYDRRVEITTDEPVAHEPPRCLRDALDLRLADARGEEGCGRDGGGEHERAQPGGAGVRARSEGVDEAEDVDDRRGAVELAPALAADPLAGVEGEAEEGGRVAAEDAEADVDRAVVDRERDQRAA